MKYINFPDEHSRLIVLSLYHFTQIQSKWPVFNDPSTNFPLPVFALYCTILVYLFHVSLCHVVHFSCYTFFTMQSFNVILSSCSTFLINWTFFMACTLFMIALLSCCTFLVLRIFHFAIFSYCIFLVLHSLPLDFEPSYVLYMIQKISCSLSSKVKWHFYDILKVCLIIFNNVNIFTMHESLL